MSLLVSVKFVLGVPKLEMFLGAYNPILNRLYFLLSKRFLFMLWLQSDIDEKSSCYSEFISKQVFS